MPGTEGFKRARSGASVEERAGLWLSAGGARLAHRGQGRQDSAARTADPGEDFVGPCAGQAVAQDDGVLARHGRVDEAGHGENGEAGYYG